MVGQGDTAVGAGYHLFTVAAGGYCVVASAVVEQYSLLAVFEVFVDFLQKRAAECGVAQGQISVAHINDRYLGQNCLSKPLAELKQVVSAALGVVKAIYRGSCRR